MGKKSRRPGRDDKPPKPKPEEPPKDDDEEDVQALDFGALKRRFDRVIRKHKLGEEPRSDDLADYINDHAGGAISADDMAQKFAIPVDDAHALLSWFQVGLQFKMQTDANAEAIGLDKDAFPVPKQ